MTRFTITAMLAGTALASEAIAQAEPPSRVVAFGASYTDVGNDHELTGGWPPSPPYDDGRFCNGPLWHEVAGAELGWPAAEASLLGGDVYAYGGALTGNEATIIPCHPEAPIPTIGLQIETFLAGNEIQPTDLFLIGLNNDLNYLLLDLIPPGKPPEVSVANMVSHVESLAAAGAESVVVLNMIPLGAAPFLQDVADEAEQLVDEYNALLGPAMDEAADAMDIDVRVLDAHSVMTKVLDDPASFGITNTTDPAQVGGSDVCTVIVGGDPVPNPDEYVWWDHSHITRAMHEILGGALVDLLSCNGDFNADGELDILDFIAFQNAFVAGDMVADCDRSGELDILDFICFQSVFQAGCP